MDENEIINVHVVSTDTDRVKEIKNTVIASVVTVLATAATMYVMEIVGTHFKIRRSRARAAQDLIVESKDNA